MSATTYTIPAATVRTVTRKVSMLAKRAAKLGLSWDVEVSFGAPYLQARPDMIRSTYGAVSNLGQTVPRVEVVDMTVIGLERAVRLDGWHYVGRVDHDRNDDGEWANTAIVHNAMGHELPPLQSLACSAPTCDHCGKARRRKSTHLVRNEDSAEVLRIGSSCLVDYVGETTAQGIARKAQWAFDLQDCFSEAEHFDAFSAEGTVPLALLLAYAAAHVREHGYLPSSSDIRSTKSVAWRNAEGEVHPSLAHRIDKQALTLTDADWDTARGTRDWARAIPEDTTSSFLLNVRTTTQSDVSKQKHAGYIVAAVTAYQRNLEREAREAVRVSKPSEWLGQQGQRFGGRGKNALPALLATVIRRSTFEGMFGLTTVMVAQTADGDELLSFCSGMVHDDAQPGALVTVCGTVKKHGHDRNNERKQTVLSRASFTPSAALVE